MMKKFVTLMLLGLFCLKGSGQSDNCPMLVASYQMCIEDDDECECFRFRMMEYVAKENPDTETLRQLSGKIENEFEEFCTDIDNGIIETTNGFIRLNQTEKLIAEMFCIKINLVQDEIAPILSLSQSWASDTIQTNSIFYTVLPGSYFSYVVTGSKIVMNYHIRINNLNTSLIDISFDLPCDIAPITDTNDAVMVLFKGSYEPAAVIVENGSNEIVFIRGDNKKWDVNSQTAIFAGSITFEI